MRSRGLEPKLPWAESAMGLWRPDGAQSQAATTACLAPPAQLDISRREEGRGAEVSGESGLWVHPGPQERLLGGPEGGRGCHLRGHGSPWPGGIITGSRDTAPTSPMSLSLILQKGREPPRSPQASAADRKSPLTCVQSSRLRLGEQAAPRGVRARWVSPPLAGEDIADGTWRDGQDSTGGKWAVTGPGARRCLKCAFAAGPTPAPAGPGRPRPPRSWLSPHGAVPEVPEAPA